MFKIMAIVKRNDGVKEKREFQCTGYGRAKEEILCEIGEDEELVEVLTKLLEG